MPRGHTRAQTRSRDAGLAAFAQFFRGYLKAWPILIACLIGPLNKYFHLIPMYRAQENLATAIVFVYGFLFAASLLHYRPVLLQRRTFSKLLPAALILLSIGSVTSYAGLIQDSIRKETELARQLGVRADQLASEQILSRTSLPNIPNGSALLAWYLAAFFSAETALVILALDEYGKTGRSKPTAQRTASGRKSPANNPAAN